MAGACVYCGAPALVTGPSGVCPQCRETLPVKKIKLGKPAGTGLKAPAFRFGGGAGLLSTQVTQTEPRAATTSGPSMFQKAAVTTEEDPLAAYAAPLATAAPDQDAFSPSVDPNPPPPLGGTTPKTSPVTEAAPDVYAASDTVAATPDSPVSEEIPVPEPPPVVDFQPQTPLYTEAGDLAAFEPEPAPPPTVSFSAPPADDPMAGFSAPPTPESPSDMPPDDHPGGTFEDPMSGFSDAPVPALTDPMADFSPEAPTSEEVFESTPSPHPEFEDFEPPPAIAETTPPTTDMHDPMAPYRDYWEACQSQPLAETPPPEPEPATWVAPFPEADPPPPIPEMSLTEPDAPEIPEPEPIPLPVQEAIPKPFLSSSTYDPMEAYRAYWEQHQGAAAAALPEEPASPETSQEIPAVVFSAPVEEPPIPETPPPTATEEPSFLPSPAEPTDTEKPVEPPVASAAPAPQFEEQTEVPAQPAAGEPATWFEHHAEAPPLAETPAPPAPATPQTDFTPEPTLEPEETKTPHRPPSALNQTLPALGLSLLVATGVGTALAMGWIGALAGGLLGTTTLLILRRSAPPALCLAPVLWGSTATLLGTLASGKGPWLTLPFPIPLTGTPATAAHLLVGLLVLPAILCWLVAKNLRDTEKKDALTLPGKLGLGVGGLGLLGAMAVFALGLKPVFAPKADAEVLTRACRGQVAMLSLLPSKGLALPPVRASLQASLMPPFMPPAAVGETTSASILISAPTVSPDQLQCEFLCTSPKSCRLTQLSVAPTLADMALHATPAVSAPAPVPVSASAALSASGETPALMNPPQLAVADLPAVGECTAVIEAFGLESAAKGKKCAEILANSRWSGWLAGFGRANCPSLTLSQPQGTCVLTAQSRGQGAKMICTVSAQVGEKPAVACQ